MEKKPNIEDEKVKFAVASIVSLGCTVPLFIIAFAVFATIITPIRGCYESDPEGCMPLLLILAVCFHFIILSGEYRKRFPNSGKQEKPKHRKPPEDFPGL